MPKKHHLLRALVAVAGFTAAAGAQTDVSELVIYALDSGPPDMFVRYSFKDDVSLAIGPLTDQNGTGINHPESLTYFPAGMFKGFYTASTGKDDGPQHYLHRINGFDGSTTIYPTQLTHRNIRGMVSLPDATAPSG